jgi:predicted phage terminase large subunit-like protein
MPCAGRSASYSRPEWIQPSTRSARENPITWRGLFQGLPRPTAGGYFKLEWFQDSDEYTPYIETLPRAPVAPTNRWDAPIDRNPGTQYTTWVRAWDLAAGAKKRNDWVVGALVTVAADGTLYLADIIRFKANWPETRERIIAQAAIDTEHLGTVYTVVEKKGLGEIATQELGAHPTFLRHPFKALDPPHGEDKMKRADPWNAKLANKQFKIVRAANAKDHWSGAFIAECLNFTGLPNGTDDQVDAVSLANQFLAATGGGELTYDEPPAPNSHEFYNALAQHYRTGDIHSLRTYNPWSDAA